MGTKGSFPISTAAQDMKLTSAKGNDEWSYKSTPPYAFIV